MAACLQRILLSDFSPSGLRRLAWLSKSAPYPKVALWRSGILGTHKARHALLRRREASAGLAELQHQSRRWQVWLPRDKLRIDRQALQGAGM